MSSKNRTISAFNTAVQEYCKMKTETLDSSLHRCLQVLCSMDHVVNLDTESTELLEFLLNVRDLLASATNLPLGWKAIQLASHLCSDKKILNIFMKEIELLPIIAQYNILKSDGEKTISTLVLLQKLLEDVVFSRFCSYVPVVLHSLVQLVLHKKQEYSHIALSVIANLSVNNKVVFLEIERLGEFEELIRLLAQSTAADVATQLNAALVLIFHKIETSVADGRFYRFFNFLAQVSEKAVQENNTKLANLVSLVLKHLSENCITCEVLHGPECQSYLQKLVSRASETFPNNTAIQFIQKLLENRILVEKQNLDFLVPKLIELLGTGGSPQAIESCLQLLILLSRSQSNNSLLEKLESEQLTEDLTQKLLKILSSKEEIEAENAPFCTSVVLSLRLLQKLCKSRSQLPKISSGLQPSALSALVQKSIHHSDSQSTPVFQTGLDHLVLESLTLLNQLACQGGDWLLTYSQLVNQTQIQRCLAQALLYGDSYYRQATLSLVGNVGFTYENIGGLAEAMCSFKNPAGDAKLRKEIVVATTSYPDVQWNRLERLLDKLENQQYQQIGTCDVIELLETKLKRCGRQEQMLRDALQSTENQLSNLKLQNSQIQAENDRFLSALLSKDEMLRTEESNNRTLSKRVEKAFLLLEESRAAFTQEKAKLDNIVNSQNKEIKDLRENKSQLENQNQILHAKFDDCALQLKKKSQEFEMLIEGLNESLKEKEIELLDKEKENESLQSMILDLKKELERSELLCKDYQGRMAESEKRCQETKEELIKLERIRQYIHDLSGGNKKVLD